MTRPHIRQTLPHPPQAAHLDPGQALQPVQPLLPLVPPLLVGLLPPPRIRHHLQTDNQEAQQQQISRGAGDALLRWLAGAQLRGMLRSDCSVRLVCIAGQDFLQPETAIAPICALSNDN